MVAARKIPFWRIIIGYNEMKYHILGLLNRHLEAFSIELDLHIVFVGDVVLL